MIGVVGNSAAALSAGTLGSHALDRQQTRPMQLTMLTQQARPLRCVVCWVSAQTVELRRHSCQLKHVPRM